MGACYSAHSRNVEDWKWRRRYRRGQTDDLFAVRPRTGNALTCVLADEETIAWATNVFPARWCMPNGSGFIAGSTFDNVLFALAGDVDHCLTDPARDHGRTSGDGGVGRRGQLVNGRNNFGARSKADLSIFDGKDIVTPQQGSGLFSWHSEGAPKVSSQKWA